MSDELPDFDLSTFLPYRLTIAGERLSAGMAKQYRSEFGISVAEWRILVHLADAGEVSVRDLERMVSLEKSKASRAATRLAEEGYITKTVNEGDRRLVRLSLSPKGRALMAQLIPLAVAYQKRLEALIADHMRGLDAALETLLGEDL